MKKPSTIIIVLLLAVAIGAYFYMQKRKKAAAAPAGAGNIVSEASGTGPSKDQQNVTTAASVKSAL